MIYRAINGLIRHAIEADLITNDDIFVVRNQLMDILKLTDWNDKEPLTGNIEELLEPLIDYAVKNNWNLQEPSDYDIEGYLYDGKPEIDDVMEKIIEMFGVPEGEL